MIPYAKILANTPQTIGPRLQKDRQSESVSLQRDEDDVHGNETAHSLR